MILDDILQVVYAPMKAFKKIIENPKYLGAIIILLLFIGLQIGYEYVQFSKTYTENTSPAVNQLPAFLNVTYWSSTSNLALSNNYNDPYNYSVYAVALGAYYSLFGNSSLEMNATGTNVMTAATLNIATALISSSGGAVSSVDCSAPSGFQNLSMTIKQVQPTVAPQNATLTLYSLSDSNSYQYDLTSALSNTNEIGLWNNLTIPVGPSAQGWKSSGSPLWGNVTALQLTLNYPAGSNITVLIGALFFRGQYQTPVKSNSTGIILEFLETFSLQFILSWLLITGFIYLFFKALKTSVVWKPLFVALAFALFVMVIRALVNLVAAATLPTLYYPFDMSVGVSLNNFGAIFYPPTAVGALSAQSQAIFNSINSATAGFRFVTSAMFVVAYVWLGALCTIIVGTLKPEFSMAKRVVISAVSIAITLLILLFVVFLV